MIANLSGHGIVHSLRYLVHESGQILIASASLVDVERTQKHFAESSGACPIIIIHNEMTKTKRMVWSIDDVAVGPWTGRIFTNVLMSHAPAFNSRRDEGMSETVGGGEKGDGERRVQFGVVRITVALTIQVGEGTREL